MSKMAQARHNARVIVRAAASRGHNVPLDEAFNVPRHNLPTIQDADILQQEALKAGLSYNGQDGFAFSFQRVRNP